MGMRVPGLSAFHHGPLATVCLSRWPYLLRWRQAATRRSARCLASACGSAVR